MTAPGRDSRNHLHELSLAAPLDVVWRAITTADDLVRWFPFEARADGRAGGTIELIWGPQIRGRCRILAWEPPHHLRTTWMDAANPATDRAESPSPTFVDWHLETKGGRTVLRLVHSGFGAGATFDQEFDGTRRGWAHELEALRCWIEGDRAAPRRVFWAQVPVELSAGETWRRLTEPDGFVRALPDATARASSRCRIELATGDVFEGEIVANAPPEEFAATLVAPVRALFRMGFERCHGVTQAHAFFETWSMPPRDFAALESRVTAALHRCFS